MRRNTTILVLTIGLSLTSCTTVFSNNEFIGSIWEGFYAIEGHYSSGLTLEFISNKHVRVFQYERTGYSASYSIDYIYSIGKSNNLVIEAESDVPVTMNGTIYGEINNDEIRLYNFKGKKMAEKLSIEEGDSSIILKKQQSNTQLKYTEWESLKYEYNDTNYSNIHRKIKLIFWLNNIVCMETFETVYYDSGWAVGIYLTPLFVNYSVVKNEIILDINGSKISGIENGLVYADLNHDEIVLKDFNGNKELKIKKTEWSLNQ